MSGMAPKGSAKKREPHNMRNRKRAAKTGEKKRIFEAKRRISPPGNSVK